MITGTNEQFSECVDRMLGWKRAWKSSGLILHFISKRIIAWTQLQIPQGKGLCFIYFYIPSAWNRTDVQYVFDK